MAPSGNAPQPNPALGEFPPPRGAGEADGEILGPFGHDFSTVAGRLLELPRERVVFVPNPGNAGDTVIATGTFELFRRIGFEPEIGRPGGFYPDAHLVYSGGGNLIELYRHTRNHILRHRECCRSFTLLPHTVRGNEDLLESLDDRFVLFARDAASFEHLRRHARGARVFLAHDMAFMNDFCRLDTLARTPAARRENLLSATGRRQMRSLALWRAKRLFRLYRDGGLPRGDVLNALRQDRESAGAVLPPGNVDLSHRFQFTEDSSPFMAGQIARAFAAALARYDTVRTDRLHVAITAAMLGKAVEMGDNSYGKLRGVYEQSMTGFPKVRLL